MDCKLLDCTLRDGGYHNNWVFGERSVACIFTRLQKAKIDIIEIGYLRNREDYVLGRAVYPNTKTIDDTFSRLKNASSIAVMIDYGDCEINSIDRKENTSIDIIRVTFRKNKVEEALEYSSKLIKKGYDISLQPVSVTSYSTEELERLVQKVNILHPDTLSIVDSYGFATESRIIEIFDVFDKNLLPDISISYHAHNNLQLAFANSTNLARRDSKRTLVLDASLYGMGKSAGNCNTELLAMYLNKECGKDYGINEILDTIEREIFRFKGEVTPKWGYQLRYFVSAMYGIHPNYVNYLLSSGFRIKEVAKIVPRIENDKKTVFDKDYIAHLSRHYYRRMGYAEDCKYSELKRHEQITVIFDLDGTLVDSAEGIIQAVSYTIQHFKLKELSKDQLHDFVAYSPLREAFKYFCGIGDKLAEQCCDTYRGFYREKAIYKSVVYPSVGYLLRILRERECKLGVATLKDEDNTKLLLRSLNLGEYFDCIAGADYKREETKFDILIRCMKELHSESKRTIYIGDTEGDMEAAEKVGVRFIAVGYGFGFRNLLGYANSPEEVLKRIEDMND